MPKTTTAACNNDGMVNTVRMIKPKQKEIKGNRPVGRYSSILASLDQAVGRVYPTSWPHVARLPMSVRAHTTDEVGMLLAADELTTECHRITAYKRYEYGTMRLRTARTHVHYIRVQAALVRTITSPNPSMPSQSCGGVRPNSTRSRLPRFPLIILAWR